MSAHANEPIRASSSQEIVATSTIDPLASLTSPTASDQQQARSDRPTIRHGGRAHIRGKIRRVWRPRFLELWDNGLVRYYELPSDDFQNHQDDWQHSSPYWMNASNALAASGVSPVNRKQMIPKYTLRIFEARILDVTTLRDMHVGLPRGSYGFVFRGQRLMHLEEDNTSEMNMITTAGSVSNNHAGLLRTSGCAPTDSIQEQRDFLCAVSSLEEAQMWVVALQWAASQLKPIAWMEPWWNESNQLGYIMEEPNLPNRQRSQSRAHGESVGSMKPSESWDHTEDAMMGVKVLDCSAQSSPEVSKQSSPVLMPANTTSSAPTLPTESILASDLNTPARHSRERHLPIRPRKPATGGKVVVTKVSQFRAVRISAWQLEIAYQVHGVILRKDEKVEQWIMLRTAQDFQKLVNDLCQELGPALMDRAPAAPIRTLPRLKDRPSLQQIEISISTVDSLLRSLVMDAATVNAAALRVFLAIPGSRPKLQPLSTRWWKLHNSRSVVSHQSTILDPKTTPENFVKQWLQECSAAGRKQQQSSMDLRVVTLFQRPIYMWGGLGATALPAFYWMPRLWHQYVPTLSLRLDVLVVSWIGAAYLGSYYGQQQQNDGGARPTGPRQNVSQALPSSTVGLRAPQRTSVDDSHRSREHAGSIAVDNMLDENDDGSESDGEEMPQESESSDSNYLPSPIPKFPDNDGTSCWSQPKENIFYVRGATYLKDRVKVHSDPAPLTCRGVDVWMTDSPQRHIARHPSVLGGKLGDQDTFLVNFLLPFGNLVAYFGIPPLNQFPRKLQKVWTKFLKGDQQYRDARLKLLPVVAEGPWIVKAAVGPGKSPAVLGKVIPLQYFFRDPDRKRKGVYEVDVIITASSIAKGILSVVKGHTKSVSIAFAFIIEGVNEDELPENVLCCFQLHSLHLEDCPTLPACNLDEHYS